MTKLIPIYTSSGDCLAYLSYPYIFDVNGDWIAFVIENRSVYSNGGDYLGWITDDPRIVRTISSDGLKGRIEPPPSPDKKIIAETTVFAPLMSDLPNSQIDVLQDEPHKFYGNG